MVVLRVEFHALYFYPGREGEEGRMCIAFHGPMGIKKSVYHSDCRLSREINHFSSRI